MSLQGLLPARVVNVDALGRPRWALSITSVVGVFFAYLSLNEGGNEALNWFIAITSASFFSNWAIIGYSNLRFRQALKAQNDHLLDEEYGWKAAMGIFTPIYLIIVSTLLLVCLLYLAISPSGGSFTAANFFQYTIDLLLIIVFSLAYKVIRRTKWVEPATADLTAGAMPYESMRFIISTDTLGFRLGDELCFLWVLVLLVDQRVNEPY